VIELVVSCTTCTSSTVVEYGGADVAAASASATARSGAAASSLSSAGQHPHRSRIVVHIYALSQKSTEAVVADIEKVIGEYLMDRVLDQPQDQEHIAKLTEQQVLVALMWWHLHIAGIIIIIVIIIIVIIVIVITVAVAVAVRKFLLCILYEERRHFVYCKSGNMALQAHKHEQ